MSLFCFGFEIFSILFWLFRYGSSSCYLVFDLLYYQNKNENIRKGLICCSLVISYQEAVCFHAKTLSFNIALAIRK